MPITDGWANFFRLSSDDRVAAPDAEFASVGALFGGDGPAAWMTTTVDDVVDAMDAAGVERALLTVDGHGGAGPGGDRIVPTVETGLAACRRAPGQFRLVLQILEVTAPHTLARTVRDNAGHAEVAAVGLFPGSLGCDLDDRRLYPLYDACIESGLPVRINVGIAGPLVPSRHQHPARLEDLLLDFPELTVIGAHMGHPHEALMIQLMMKFPHLYLMSSGYLAKYFDPALVRFMGSSRGVGRVLFGSDHPGIPLQRAIDEARRLPIDDTAKSEFLGDALCRILEWA